MNQPLHEKSHTLLEHIHSPSDLKALPLSDMPKLAEELRSELVRIVSDHGGHLASNLGVVELTMAIHRVFDAPTDHIIFDVGHQSYVHKILTGRREAMHTLRTSGGISGFTNRTESEYDCFGAGHSSTSLSAALGFAVSDKLNGRDAYTVAIVGDGAYTGGMIHEALNNCRKDLRLIIILNENEMSISKNIGRFAAHLAKLRNKKGYFKTKQLTGAFLKKIPLIGKWLFRTVLAVKKAFKNMLYGSNYFESMGLTYLGPIDGHDYETVESLLMQAKSLQESVVLHVKTTKGKGYAPAEADPSVYHGISPSVRSSLDSPNFSHVMGDELTRLGEHDETICAITAAMCDGTGLEVFKESYPARFFDVGIAEPHALTFAAGLAASGMHPVVPIYSTFLQRGYDNIIHDIALQGLPVTLCVDRAGLNASDGATHHGIFDVSFLQGIPGIRIYTPITNDMLRISLREAVQAECPCVLRYPNGREDAEILEAFYPEGATKLMIARADYQVKDPITTVIITHGRIVKEALLAKRMAMADGICVGIILLEQIKPVTPVIDTILSLLPASVHSIVFLEEEIRNGGMGMVLSDALKRRDIPHIHTVHIMAVDDSFVTERKAGEDILCSAHISCRDILSEIHQLNGDNIHG